MAANHDVDLIGPAAATTDNMPRDNRQDRAVASKRDAFPQHNATPIVQGPAPYGVGIDLARLARLRSSDHRTLRPLASLGSAQVTGIAMECVHEVALFATGCAISLVRHTSEGGSVFGRFLKLPLRARLVVGDDFAPPRP